MCPLNLFWYLLCETPRKLQVHRGASPMFWPKDGLLVRKALIEKITTQRALDEKKQREQDEIVAMASGQRLGALKGRKGRSTLHPAESPASRRVLRPDRAKRDPL